MKKKFTWWQILCGILDLIAMVVIILCLTTDINDDLFLPCALVCVAIANVTLLVMNIRYYRNKKK